MARNVNYHASTKAWFSHSFTMLSLIALPGLLASTAIAQSDGDFLMTLNGNTLTGEIKFLDRGMLRFDTDATDTIAIEWAHVAALTSAQNFFVTLEDDRQIFGTLVESDEAGTLRLSTAVGPTDLPVLSIVRMTPIEGRLIDRIDMSIDAGYNITKANNVTQTNLGYDFSYRSEERQISLSLNGTRSSSSNGPVSIRSNSIVSYRRFATDRLWDPIGLGTFERNDELELERRVTAGAGFSRWLTDTNSNRISFVGGLVATREKELDSIEPDESIEAAVAIALDWFRYEDPELDVTMQFAVYERLTDSGRTRGNLDADLRWELVNDFFWGLSIYYTFNSQPIGDTISSDDYGVTTTIGWSF